MTSKLMPCFSKMPFHFERVAFQDGRNDFDLGVFDDGRHQFLQRHHIRAEAGSRNNYFVRR